MSLRRKPINFDKKFSELEMMLDAIFTFSALNTQGISGMNMYQLVYDMCNAIPRPFTDRLYMGVAEYIDKHTVRCCESILSHDDIATAYAREFERFELAAGDVSRGCDYLNRLITQTSTQPGSDRRPTVIGGKYKKQNVQALAMTLWKTNVLFTIRDRYQNRLFYQIFEMIRRGRDGNEAPESTIKTVVTSLVQANAFTDQPLQLYIEEFERPYLVHTKRYFEAEAAREIAAGNISVFMRRAAERLQQEITRNNRYCHSTSHPRIVKEFEAQYISAYKDRMVDEFSHMLEKESFEDCTLAYTLLSRIQDGLKPILAIYEEYITKLGKDILVKLGQSVAKNPKAYVDQLLTLHVKYYTVNAQVFASDPQFTAAVDKAFRTIVNDTQTNPAANGPETLARYCDMMMRKNSAKKDVSTVVEGKKKAGALRRPLSENEDYEPEEKLMRMITLFKYVDDKDVFQKFYSRMLAKRLIYGTSASEELEAEMINRLKEICGVEYTSKLNKMFTDISLSNDLNVTFKEFLKQNSQRLDVGFEMQVLTAGAWPLSQKEDAKTLDANKIQIPTELEKSVSLFERFYGQHYNGRKLLWQWNLARGELRLTYLDRPYEIQVGLYQMIILLLFNDSTSLAVNEMAQQSGLPEIDIVRGVKPLIDSRLLEAPSEGLNSETRVSLNMSFTSKRTKIKVAVAAMGEQQQQEAQATRKSLEEDRRMYLQAAIVRIMKSRQTLTHVQLVQEVIDQAHSRFSPSVMMIKKCIEQLLEKQFIARKERDTYVYVA